LDTQRTYTTASDAELWDAFLSGSKEAYAYMYQKYAKVLFNYGFKIAPDRDLVEDCIQDLFLIILETRERLGHTTSIKFYLMRSLRREIVRKLNNDHRFSNSRLDGDDLLFVVDFHYEPSWLDSQISKERAEALLQELNHLPARQKEAIFLKFFDNLSYEEIAGIMGIETTSAYKVIYKAIAALQKRMLLDTFLWAVVAGRLVG
jgi:RNA polymerase sigma factor (sigma-70 family)